MAARQSRTKAKKQPVQNKKPARKVGKQITKQEMKALEVSMAKELAKPELEKLTPSRKKPFDDALLPEEKAAGQRAGRTTWVLPTLFVLALVAIWVWFASSNAPHSQAEAGVKQALKNIAAATTAQDVTSFDKHVNTPTLAASIASQMFTAPEGALTGPAAAEFSALQTRFDDLVKPALTQDIEADLRTFAATGELGSVSVLGQLRNDIAPSEATFSVQNINVTAATSALATLQITRPDLTLEETVTLPLTLNLTQTDAGNWQVTDIVDLNATLTALSDAENALSAARAAESATQLGQALTTNRITKAAIDDNTLLAALDITNTSGKDIASFTGVIAFADAAGRVLKEIPVQHQDPLAAGENLGKTWTLAVDTTKPGERHIIALPMSAMNAAFTAESISFADGTLLE